MASLLLAIPAASAGPQTRELFVAPRAAVGGDGSRGAPLATLEAARDLHRLRTADGEGASRRIITLLEGTWWVRDTIDFDADDSGLRIRADRGARARLIGGLLLTDPELAPVTDPDLRRRLPTDAARDAVRVLPLPANEPWSGPVHRGMGAPVVPVGSEVFLGGVPLTRARWPDAGFALIAEVLDPGSVPRNRADDIPEERRETGPDRGGIFRVESERMARWAEADQAWAFGYWFHDWADEQLPIQAIDVGRRTIQLGLPHRYGLKSGTTFYVTNLLEELDAPGEYFLDVPGHRLILWPPERADARELLITTLGDPVLRIRGAKDLVIEGLAIEGTRGPGIIAEDVDGVVLRDLRITHTGTRGISLRGTRCLVDANEILGTGAGGVSVTGGHRQELRFAHNRVTNNRIHGFGRVYRTYQPGVRIGGVGQVVRGNELAHAPHSALLFSGNEHVIEDNEIFDVLRETGDCGAIYCGRDWTMHGTRIRGNFIHHLRGKDGRWQNAIYLDDMASGIQVSGNLIWRCHWGMLVGGGRDLRIEDNVFAECGLGVRFDARGVGWMASHIADPKTSTLHRGLAAMPVGEDPWRSCYPSLTGYRDDRFGRPAGSRMVGNSFLDTPIGSVADRECVLVADNLVQEQAPTWLRGVPGEPFDAEFDPASPFAQVGLRGRPPSKTEAGLVLADRGQSDWSIVIPEHPESVEREAAQEFARLMAAVSGARLGIHPEPEAPEGPRILIGATAAAAAVDKDALGEDGFVVRVQDGDLVLAGGAKEPGPQEGLGTLYAVYHFFEQQFGCRFWAPGAVDLPRRETLRIPRDLDLTQVPKVWFRHVNYGPAADLAYRRWHKLDRIQEEVGRLWAPRWVHSMFAHVPPEQYFDEHPEYYSLVGGERRASQLCLTNPEVLEITTASIRRVLEEHPGVRYLSISQEDNYEACQCADARAINEREGSQMGELLTFLNALADRFPDQILSTLAYQYSRQPPKHLRPRSNVSIMLCTIEEDRSRPIATNPTSGFPAEFEGWCEIAEDIFLWDYEVQFASPVAPFPNLRVLQPNVKWFVDRGVRHLFLQGNGRHTEFAELRCYLLAKLTWNPDLDVPATIREFLDGFYGPAAPMLGDYLDLLHDEMEASGEALLIYGNPALAKDTWLRPEVMERARTLFARAEQAVLDDAVLASRVRTARLPLMYADLEITKRRAAPWKVRERVTALLEEFLEGLRVAGIRRLRERDLTPEEYHAAWQTLLDPSLPDHDAFGRSVTATPPPGSKYADGDVQRLTDGLPGGDQYHENWVGWEGTDAVIQIDLGQAGPRSHLSLSALQDPKSWVWLPRVIEVSGSTDGASWSRIARLSHDRSDREPLVHHYEVVLAGAEGAASFRFLRLSIDANETCPDWHLGAGGPAWFFLDEIRVN